MLCDEHYDGPVSVDKDAVARNGEHLVEAASVIMFGDGLRFPVDSKDELSPLKPHLPTIGEAHGLASASALEFLYTRREFFS